MVYTMMGIRIQKQKTKSTQFKKKGNKIIMVKSLAVSPMTDYVSVQIRAKGEDCCDIVKVQGRGISVNRGYGVTGDVVASKEFTQWLSCDVPHNEESLAGTSQSYVAAQVAIRGGSLHFQIPSPFAFQGVGKRGYGAVLDVDKNNFPELVQFIEAGGSNDAIIFDNDGDGGCCNSCCH